jgi:hypothetical protein
MIEVNRTQVDNWMSTVWKSTTLLIVLVGLATVAWYLSSDSFEAPQAISQPATNIEADSAVAAEGVPELSIPAGANPDTHVWISVRDPVSGARVLDYSKDDRTVYWSTEQDSGVVPQADPATFTTNDDVYPFAYDATHVFFANHSFDGADPRTLRAFPLSEYAHDSKQVYWHGGPSGVYSTVVAGADSATFSPYEATADTSSRTPSYYARDIAHVFCQGYVLLDADVTSFVQDGTASAHDSKAQYEVCNKVDPLVP